MSVNLLVKNAGDNYDTPAFNVKQQFGKQRSHGWDCPAGQTLCKALLMADMGVPL